MKITFKKIFLLIFPFFFMVFINETVRPSIKEEKFILGGVSTINSSIAFEHKCSWICHNNTLFCKKHHVKFKYFRITDPFYFGIIYLLGLTGNYGAANIFFLVIGFPLLMWFLLIKIISIQEKINKNIKA